MKKLVTALFVIIVCLQLSAQQYFDNSTANGKPVLVLMNPTVNNLKTVFYLIDNQIFPVPEEFNFVGFYHTAQTYDFSKSADLIRESGRKNFFLQACSDLPGQLLYGENPCSDDFRAVFENSRGVIFFGGPDIPPTIYGEETNLLTVITDYHRHTFEASFLFHLLGGYQDDNFIPLLEQKPDYFIFGICLGMQTLNVATGGTLIQDIPTDIYGQKSLENVLAADADTHHRNYFTNYGTDDDLIWGSFHRINILLPERMLVFMSASDPNPYVLSSHHQSAGRIGKGLLVAAGSMDGKVVETLVHAKYPNVVGFQFHPEPSFLYKPEEKLKSDPGKPEEKSFIDLYPGAAGENFNRNLWKWAAQVLKQSK